MGPDAWCRGALPIGTRGLSLSTEMTPCMPSLGRIATPFDASFGKDRGWLFLPGTGEVPRLARVR